MIFCSQRAFAVAATTVVLTTAMTVEPAAAQQTASVTEHGETRDDAKVLLARRVSLDVTSMALETAIRTLAKRAGVQIQYRVETIEAASRPVTVHVSDVPLGAALAEVLDGTALRVVADAGGGLVVTTMDGALRMRQQSEGVVLGLVIDSITRRPIAGVTVMVEGTKIAARSNDLGRFVVTRVPVGAQRLAARRLGYRAQELRVAVRGGDTVAAQFALVAVATQLNDVVTTGAGERQRREVGYSVGTIEADSLVQTSAIRNLTDLLAGQVPGAQVMTQSGAVGAAKRIRLRGIQSISGSNDPIFIVDGVRISNAYGACRASGQSDECQAATARVDDIDVDLIESVDVLKGPAASTLYGSDAANGVIVIKTKRGRAGPARWHVRADQGFSYYDSKFPTVARAFGSFVYGDVIPCGLVQQVNGECGQLDSVYQSNILEDPDLTSLAHGRTGDYSVDVAGGSQAVQYFLAGGYLDRLGTSRLPKLNARILSRAKGGAKLSDEIIRPNAETNANFTGRLTGQLNSHADFSISSQLARRYQRRGSDGSYDLYTVRSPGDSTSLTPAWAEQFFLERDERTTHSTNNVNLNWQPLAWLANRGTYGYDLALSDDRDLARRDACTPFCPGNDPQGLGRILGGTRTNTTHSLDLGSVLTIPVSGGLTSRTAIGGQYVRTMLKDLHGAQYDLNTGQTQFRRSLSGTTSSFFNENYFDETSDDRATAGIYIDQTMSVNDRLFLNVAARRDASSDFGDDDVKPVYPKASLSWVASDEPIFPWRQWMRLRLRAAYGHAGVQPGSTVRLRTIASNDPFIIPGQSPAVGAFLSSLGNELIKPERTVEREYGFELGGWQDRVTLEYTRYNKFTEDALVARPLPPSLSLGSTGLGSRMENIGNVRNVGTEVTVGARLLQQPAMSWYARIGFASRHNTLVTLGAGVIPFSNEGGYEESRVAEGYPLFGRWARPILSYADANNDGIIALDEVAIGDSSVYLGPSQSKYDLSIHHDLGFFHDRFRIAADFQYQNGLVQLNEFMARFVNASPVTQIRGAGTLQEQAYAVAASSNQPGGGTFYGYYENTNVLRFSTLSLNYALPERVARLARGRAATVGVVATNVGLWTNYRGKDPEVNTSSAGQNRLADGGQFPAPKTWAFRLNINF